MGNALRTAQVLAATGLAFALGGIWLGNIHFMNLVPGNGAVAGMRLDSLVVYAVFLAIVFVFQKRENAEVSAADETLSVRGLIDIAIIVSIIAYAAGAIATFVAPSLAPVGLCVSKLSGAPLTIAAVLVLGSMPYGQLTRWALLGVFCGSAISAMCGIAVDAFQMTDITAVFIAFVLVVIASGCLHLALGTVADLYRSGELSREHVIERPMSKVLSAGVVCGLIVVSLMLGFTQSTVASVLDANALPAAITLLLVSIAIGLYKPDEHIAFFFLIGLACVAAGAFTSTFTSPTVSTASQIIQSVGTTTFEAVTYIMCAWAVRNSAQKIVTASLTRLWVVLGHLIGTGLAVAEGVLVTAGVQTQNAANIVVVSLYMALLVVVRYVPTLQSMLFGIPAIDEDSKEANSGQAIRKDTPAPVEPASQQLARSQGKWDGYWTAPCRHVASVYGLTPRETDVLEQLARGHSISSIEEALVLSNSTVKMHVRHVYQKLDVHTKQAVIDVVDAARDQIAKGQAE